MRNALTCHDFMFQDFTTKFTYSNITSIFDRCKRGLAFKMPAKYECEAFPRYWPYVRGMHPSPMDSSHKGQWRKTFLFSSNCSCENGWANNRDAGDLRRHRSIWRHCSELLFTIRGHIFLFYYCRDLSFIIVSCICNRMHSVWWLIANIRIKFNQRQILLSRRHQILIWSIFYHLMHQIIAVIIGLS